MKVFFSNKLWAENDGAFSPSAKKPKQAVESWLSRGNDLTIIEPEMVSATDLARAHDHRYVRDVMTLEQANGFGNKDAQVAAALPFTSGAMYEAAKAAIMEGVACAPVSGFHHACFNHGGGFCTFNGLMVTALKLRNENQVREVGILDFDQHYGNGTDDIINQLQLGDWVHHFTQGSEHCTAAMAEAFLEGIPELIEEYFSSCDVLLYQAGADPHINDPLGGWLTTEQMRRRDKIVFETCKRLNLPVAWNLAGGYQKPIEKVLEIHNNTMDECLEIFFGVKNEKAS